MENIGEMSSWIDKQKWTEAKSYSGSAPHEYLLRWEVPRDQKYIFDKLVRLINEKGFWDDFYYVQYKYLVIGDKKYWTMDKDIKKTNLINRADKNRMYKINDNRKEKIRVNKSLLE